MHPQTTVQSTARFPTSMKVRLPAGLPEAIDLAARRRHTSAPEVVRQAILRCLREEGIEVRDGQVELIEARA